MKIASWNLLHRSGATVEEILRIIRIEEPDVLLMQEVIPEIDILPAVAGGHYQRHPWPGKQYGMAIWSTVRLEVFDTLHLPFTKMPGSFPQRFAQITEINGITIANVHLSHGQVLNRRQLTTIANGTNGATVIMGDFNAVGPVVMKNFRDIGPRKPTHRAQKIVPFRLDRCLVRGLGCNDAKVLHPHSSDHHPIVVSLDLNEEKSRAVSQTVV